MRLKTPEQNYLSRVFPLNDPDLLKVKQKLQEHSLDAMSVSGPEARILQFLIRGFGVRRIVEIGTLFGYSAIAMAKVLPADGFVLTLEKSAENARMARTNVEASSYTAPIEVVEGDALESLRSIEGRGPFDMVFIDANKSAYGAYLEWAERNVRPGGLIVGDNTFLWGGVWGDMSRDAGVNERTIEVMQQFNMRLADTSLYNSILIPTFEGMTVAQKL